MNKRYIYLILFVTAVIAIPSIILNRGIQGNGQVTTEARDVSGFTSVVLTNSASLTIQQGTDFALEIEAESNLLDYLENEVNNDTLTLKSREGAWLRPTKAMHYTLTVPRLSSVRTNASGSITILGAWDEADFSIESNASGSISLESLNSETVEIQSNASGAVTINSLDATTLNLWLTASGSVNILAGTVQQQTVQINASGAYLAANLSSEVATVSITGSGSAEILVNERLDATLTASGVLLYHGTPQVNQRVTGTGRIQQAN